MEQDGVGPDQWTAARVEARLINAFRLLRGIAVRSSGTGLVALASGPSERDLALNWTKRFVTDSRQERALLTWARCRASGDSVRERYREMGLKRATAERHRRQAVARIVTCLQIEQKRLDIGTNGPGASRNVEAEAVLANA